MKSLIGKTLKNRYRVEESLGHGGMAEVYKVWDTQRGVPLAMKVLREDLAEDIVFLRRFEREAKNLTRLQHPNIVRCYGLEREGHTAFMLMDYIDGWTLRSEIFDAHGPLPMNRILEIMRPICSALNYAHQMGMVHCDVKSANIMISKKGMVYLTDFGIARGMDATTSTMVGIGTPAYMAPELIKGQDPTPQTDIYALGIVLYEMLTGGERPFTGERATITGTTADKVRWEHLQLEPYPIAKKNKGVRTGIQNLINRCLEKKAKIRVQDTHEFFILLSELINETKNKREESQKNDNYINQKEREVINKTSLRMENKTEKHENKKSNKKSADLKIIISTLILITITILFFLVSKISVINNNSYGTKTPTLASSTEISGLISTEMNTIDSFFFQATEDAEENLITLTEEVQNNKKEVEIYKNYLSLEEMNVISNNVESIYYESYGRITQPYNFDVKINDGSYGENFILDITFINPKNNNASFDYGIIFRDYYLLILQPYINYYEIENYSSSQIICYGYSNELNKKPFEKNRIVLIVIGTTCRIYINNVLVDVFSIENEIKLTEYSYYDIGVGTGYIHFYNQDDYYVPFEKFKIIKFNSFY